MFEFFRSKPSVNRCIKFAERMVHTAQIEPHYKNGQYVAFMISFDCTPEAFARHLGDKDAKRAMVNAIERRIMIDRRFSDADNDMVQVWREASHWQPNMYAKRIVHASNKPLCVLEVDPPGENGKSRIQLQIMD